VNKRQIRIFAAITAGLMVLVAALAWPAMQRGYGFGGTLACMVTTGRHATRYASGFSESTFAQVQTGMTQKEVLGLLGQPLERVTFASSPAVEWRYSQAATRSGHFHLRTVRFTPEGKVKAAVRGFHLN